MLQNIGVGKYYLDYGPMQMTISAFELLKELTACLDVAKFPLAVQGSANGLPEILKSP